MVLAAAMFVLVARPARVPTIVAYILTGLLLGPLTGLISLTEGTALIADAGVVLLLFLVGLELSLERIREVGRVAIIAGLGQVAFTFVGGMGLAYLLGFPVGQALFIAAALTFSSTIVPVKLLTEKKQLDTLYGRIAVGVFMVQNLVVIVALAVVSGISGAESGGAGAIVTGLLASFTGIGAMLVIALSAARYVFPALFRWIGSALDGMFIWSLCWCFLFVVVAEWLGLSVEMGALAAGLALAQLPYTPELRRRTNPLMSFFMAIFFLSLGIGLELESALDQWLPGLLFSLFVLLGNPLSIMWLIARMGYSERTSFMASVAVAQISEFSLVFGAMGVTAGLIGIPILSVLTLVALITMVVSAYMIFYSERLYEALKGTAVMRIFHAAEKPEEDADGRRGKARGHVIVVGLNSLGSRLVERLIDRGESVLAIDTDPRKLAPLPCATLLGSVDHPTVLEEANLAEAKLVVSALQIEDTNNLLVYRCREVGVPCSIHAFDKSVVRELRDIGTNHLIIPSNNGVRRLLDELRSRGILES